MRAKMHFICLNNSSGTTPLAAYRETKPFISVVMDTLTTDSVEPPGFNFRASRQGA